MPTKKPPALPAESTDRVAAEDVIEVEVVTPDDKRREDMRAAVELGVGLFKVLTAGFRSHVALKR